MRLVRLNTWQNTREQLSHRNAALREAMDAAWRRCACTSSSTSMREQKSQLLHERSLIHETPNEIHGESFSTPLTYRHKEKNKQSITR
jgi:hypothetical protein